jgi:hypothetical protein
MTIWGVKQLFGGLMNSVSFLIVEIGMGAIAYLLTIYLIAPKLFRETLDFVMLIKSKKMN